MRIRRLVSALVLVAAASCVNPVLASGVVQPSYVGTIGGPGHAEIYPGGVDVDASGTVYVADTGNGQVKAYWPNGAIKWTQGVRGSKALGNFDNPRDITYLNGKLYVADLGNKRVQVLDADSGAPLSAWPVTLPSPIGITAGVNKSGNGPVVLVAQDTKNQISEYTPDGVFIRNFGTAAGGSGAGELAAPRDAATDSDGDVYVADYGNNRVAKFDAHGNWITSWGTSGGQDGQFRRPYGVAVDAQDRIYVADSTNHRIQMFDRDGIFLAKYGIAGTGPGQYSQLRRVGVAPQDPNPDIYLADLWGFKVDRVSQDASLNFTFAQTFGQVVPPDGLFNQPSGVVVTPASVYVADAVNQRMQRFNAQTGAWELSWGERGWGGDLDGFNWPRDLSLNDSSNTIWVADTKNGRFVEFDPDGNATGRTFGSLGSGLGQFNRPFSVVSYGTSLVVADSANNRVQRWDVSEVKPTLVWSSSGIGNPQAVTVDGSTVLVTDTRNNRLARLDIETGDQIGDFLGVGNLHSPEGVAVDADGRIWVGDRAYNRIVELDSDGTFLQSFGSRGSGPMQLNHPTHVTVFGNLLYVCDVWNDRVQIFDLTGGVDGAITDTFSGSVDNAAGPLAQKFTFTVADTSARIRATLSWPNTAADLNLFLYAPGSATIVAQATSRTANPETIQFQPQVTGTYTLRVKAASGGSPFDLTVTHD